ncbi:DUF1152 domain-containing protein [Kribbella sp. NPDC023855]|uniref:DUF1152 domain-containing protein n=1 Tax=Kribbella sp. NPDC023855 TaxID=3154698 RepID=UPI0033F6CCB3
MRAAIAARTIRPIMRTLRIASGGTGDLITAISLDQRIIGGALGNAYASAVWERSTLDPFPGPRPRNAVRGLRPVGRLGQFTERTRIPGGLTQLPQLAASVEPPIWYLDLADGVQGLREQLQAIMDSGGYECVDLVDTGGDILARGDEAGLISPTMDAALLAAVADQDFTATVTVLGLGVDGELSLDHLGSIVRDLEPSGRLRISAGLAAQVYRDYCWVHSESSLLALLGAIGIIGRIDIRPGSELVCVDRRCGTAWTFDANHVYQRNLVARAVRNSTSFAALDNSIKMLGLTSEFGHEVAAARRATAPEGRPKLSEDFLGSILPSATHVSVRRLAKGFRLTGASDLDRLHRVVAGQLGDDYRRPAIPVDLLPAVIQEFQSRAEIQAPPTGSQYDLKAMGF